MSLRRLIPAALTAALGTLALTGTTALAAAPEAPELFVLESYPHATTVSVQGTLNPGKEGEPGTYETGTYEYLYKESNTQCEGGKATSAGISLGAGRENVSQETLSGLKANTQYTICLRVETAGGASVSPGVTIKTALPPQTPETIAPAKSVTATTAVLEGTLNPHAVGDAGDSEFLYRPSASTCEGASATPAQSAAGNVGERVVAPVAELQPDSTYSFCLLARNSAGEVGLGAPARFRTQPEAYASDVAASSATLSAVLNPEGVATSYRFEYGSSAAYGSETPEAEAGTGTSPVTVEFHVQDLNAASVYHYRVLATNAAHETFASVDQTFTTQTSGSAFALPDGREWELVTPPSKHGALVESDEGNGLSNGGVTQSALGGDAFAFMTNAPTESQPAGYAEQVQVLAIRGPHGWESKDISIPHETASGGSIGFGAEYRFFSEDLQFAVVLPYGSPVSPTSPEALSTEATERTAFIRTNFLGGDVQTPCLSSCYRPLVTGAPGHANVPAGTQFGEEDCSPEERLVCGPYAEGTSADGRHVVVNAKTSLTSTPISSSSGALYEWSEGQLTLVSLLPESQGGKPTTSEPSLGDRSGGVNGGGRDARHAISADGSRVFFSAQYEGAEHIYMRDLSKGETVQLDAGLPESFSEGINFQDASSDGHRAFFTTSGELYECEFVEIGGHLVCDRSDLGPAVGVMLGSSEDGSWVYFVSKAVLAPGAQPGSFNLYLRHGDTTRLVATLSSEDIPDWGQSASTYEGVTSKVSPNGQWLEFMSNRELTGYDNHDALNGRPDEEVYLYSAEAEKLVCASCDPTGARPLGEAGEQVDKVVDPQSWGSIQLAASVPGPTPYALETAVYQSRYLSDSGRLFFNSIDGLVPQDVNGNWDVYEYEPPGVPAGEHACTSASRAYSPRSEGCIALISSGGSAKASGFLDASESGGDVFFITNAELAPQDFDTSIDVYDAHECTSSSPCYAAPPALPPECITADACRVPPRPQPAIFGSPSSATFSGAGNIVPTSAAGNSRPKPKATKPKGKATKCKRGFVKAKHRCVRRKSNRASKPAKGRK